MDKSFSQDDLIQWNTFIGGTPKNYVAKIIALLPKDVDANELIAKYQPGLQFSGRVVGCTDRYLCELISTNGVPAKRNHAVLPQARTIHKRASKLNAGNQR